MVINRRSPKATCDRLIHIPPMSIQMIFIMVDKQPFADALQRVSFPNGHSARPASFKVCNPNGMPIIVTNKAMLEMRYSIAMKIPPKSNHIIFPKVFMIVINKRSFWLKYNVICIYRDIQIQVCRSRIIDI